MLIRTDAIHFQFATIFSHVLIYVSYFKQIGREMCIYGNVMKKLKQS